MSTKTELVRVACFNVIIPDLFIYPFSNSTVPLKFRVGPLFRMFSFQTVP